MREGLIALKEVDACRLWMKMSIVDETGGSDRHLDLLI